MKIIKTLEKDILKIMGAKNYVPMNINELCFALDCPPKASKPLRKLLFRMIQNGKIAQVKRDKYCIPSDADLLTGVIQFRPSGSAKIIPSNESKNRNAVLVRAEDTNVALQGDLVLVRIEKKRRAKFRPKYANEDNLQFGAVVKILNRAFTTTTGTLIKTRFAWNVVPDDPRIPRNILVPDPEKSLLFPKPKENEKVIVRLNEWTRRHENLTGEIEKILGETHTPLSEYRAILYRYQLSPKFPDAVSESVKDLSEEVDKKDFDGRKDIQNIFTITIDPDDAKDFDDAISVEYLENGNTRIGIHIADVSHYVKSGSPLDTEARARGNSTYLVGTVIPMLPHILSSGLCSLIENAPRLTKSVFITFSAKKEIIHTEFANTIIRSRKRLTYSQAFLLMKNESNENLRKIPPLPAHQSGFPGKAFSELSDGEINDLKKALQKIWDIAKTLRQDRMKKGALDLDMPEMKIYVDEDGYANKIVEVVHDESHQLVEEFMLITNEIIAKTFHQNNLPFISRVHDQPELTKLNELREDMLSAGIKIGDLSKRNEMSKLLAILKERDDAYPLRIKVLRSLKQACYRAKADGHYGLAKTYYAHFTSPIRRYADLVIHRIFDFYLKKNNLPTAINKKLTPASLSELNTISEHISETERNSMDAERESTKIKLLEFFERESQKTNKTIFDAIITDIRSRGLFVELSISQAFGLIPISSLKDDLYSLTYNGNEIVGRKTKKSYKIGQTIQVTTLQVDRFQRTIDFAIYTPETINLKKHLKKKRNK